MALELGKIADALQGAAATYRQRKQQDLAEALMKADAWQKLNPGQDITDQATLRALQGVGLYSPAATGGISDPKLNEPVDIPPGSSPPLIPQENKGFGKSLAQMLGFDRTPLAPMKAPQTPIYGLAKDDQGKVVTKKFGDMPSGAKFVEDPLKMEKFEQNWAIKSLQDQRIRDIEQAKRDNATERQIRDIEYKYDQKLRDYKNATDLAILKSDLQKPTYAKDLFKSATGRYKYFKQDEEIPEGWEPVTKKGKKSLGDRLGGSDTPTTGSLSPDELSALQAELKKRGMVK